MLILGIFPTAARVTFAGSSVYASGGWAGLVQAGFTQGLSTLADENLPYGHIGKACLWCFPWYRARCANIKYCFGEPQALWHGRYTDTWLTYIQLSLEKTKHLHNKGGAGSIAAPAQPAQQQLDFTSLHGCLTCCTRSTRWLLARPGAPLPIPT